MPVTMASADQVLKIVYRELLENQLNTETDPLYNAIAATTEDVTGKQVVKAAPFGINGGMGAGTETGNLPKSNPNQYKNFVSDLRNFFGTLSISHKSMKASANNEGAFLNLLQGEIEGLKRAAKFNNSRMLYGDGVGIIATATGAATSQLTFTVNSYKYLIEGLTIDILNASTHATITNGSARRIVNVVRSSTPTITIDTEGGNVTLTGTEIITVQQSYNMEITGLGAIFKNSGSLYGVDRASNYWMVPYMQSAIGSIADTKIQKAIKYLDDVTGAKTNFLLCSSGVETAYYAYLESTKRNVNVLDLKGGFTALSYGNKPLVSSKFVPDGTMILLDTNKFKFHHMGDWEWLEGTTGAILNQIQGTPVFTATLVRYMEMICDHPGGQAMLTGISEG
ncbi:phage major capsid protein [Clostridium sp. WILCCON 0269]|uniref:Phage major capsid protein n=1 Tax=Candidatus Clostridium eludens TaxID=3381663 RepID=A0ABW8SMT3_9CLOT